MGLDRNKRKEITLAVTIFLGVMVASCFFALIALLFVPENIYSVVTTIGIFLFSAIGINIWNSLKKPRCNSD